MRQETSPSFPVSIFVAGDYGKAREICRSFCDKEGLCVTVTPTSYVYAGGEEAGVIVGLINCPRFPAHRNTIAFKAATLALELMHGLEQGSVTVQTPIDTRWFSVRAADLALAIETREGGDAKQGSVEDESAGRNGNAQEAA